MVEKCDFYCLSFQNEKRKTAMENRFKNLGIDAYIYEGVTFNDERIARRDLNAITKRVWSFTYGHFDIIREFYFNSEKEYGIFCEDDIIIRKDFAEQLPKIIENFEKMNLDMLLLGYLTQYMIDKNNCNFYLKGPDATEEHPFSYHNLPNFIWGAQMYLLSRKQAGELIHKYAPPYADLTLTNSSLNPFNSDWTITKEGNRALIFPMMAIEDGKTKYSDNGQQNFHDECHKNNYVEGLFYE